MTWFKRIVLFLLSALVAAAIYFTALLKGWLVPDTAAEDISDLITPHLTVYRPDGEGPFKTILMFHGCGGDAQQQHYWGAQLKSWGFAAVYVDSYAGRGIDHERALSKVCRGRELLGTQRAADVLAAITWANQQTWTAKQDITLMGWSHGAWSIMDAYALNAKEARPYGLADNFTGDLASIPRVVLFYPYCGMASQTSEKGWSLKPSVLAIDVEEDTVVGTQACTQSYDWVSKSGAGVEHHIIEGVDHAFDVDAVSVRDNWTYRTPKEAGLKAVEQVKGILRQFLGQP